VDSLARDRGRLSAEAKTRFGAGCAWWPETAELARMASAEQTERYEGDDRNRCSRSGARQNSLGTSGQSNSLVGHDIVECSLVRKK
jgi:hypothetical protein